MTTKDVFITLSSETRQRTLKPMSQLRKQAAITTAKCFPEGCIESLSMYYVIYIAKYEHKIWIQTFTDNAVFITVHWYDYNVPWWCFHNANPVT